MGWRKDGTFQYFPKCFGAGFQYADPKGETGKVCGDCAHWLGDCKHGGRHDFQGRCLYAIGRVCSDFPCDCPYYCERKEGELNYVDWVEVRVEKLGGEHDSKPENRALRRQALREWKESHD